MTTVRKPVRLRPLASAVRISPLLAAVPMALPGAASAATIKVTDPSSYPGSCSIVDAVNSINYGFLWPGANCTQSGGAFGVNDTIDLSNFVSPTKISFASVANNNPNIVSEAALTLLVPAKISGSLLPNGVPIVTIERSPYANGSFRLIDTSQDLYLQAITLAGGRAVGPGGAISTLQGPNAPQVTLRDAVLSDNRTDAYGGAIATHGSVIVTNSLLDGNQAMIKGGAIFAVGASSNVVIDHSIVRNNSAGVGGGVFSAAVFLQHSAISGNSAVDNGGGLYCDNVFSNYTRILNNTAGIYGGGVYGRRPNALSSITLSHSTLSGNSAHDGGGVFAASVTLYASTVNGNSAGHDGGGVNSDYLHATSSTISGNTAVISGGGILVNTDNTVISKMLFSTVAGNSATHGAGIFVAAAAGVPNAVSLASTSTLFFGNSGGTDVGFGNAVVLFVNGQHLLVGSADPGTQLPGGTLNCDPQLGPLANNTGPTFTRALPNGSCAINTGDPGTVLIDQRGYPRSVGNGADIGAFEFQAIDPVIKDGFEL